MASPVDSLEEVRRRLDEVQQFLSVSLSIANAHTVEFYTRDVWKRFMAVPPEEVLSAVTPDNGHKRAPEHKGNEKHKTTYGFCATTKRLIDTCELLEAAKAHSLPGLGVCMTRDTLLQSLRQPDQASLPAEEGAYLEPDEFMNSKKSHEVQAMSDVVACLARRCGVKQVIDVGSGKGYLCSFLSLRYGLQVFGIDSSRTNTHGAQERNRKLKKFSRAYQRHNKAARNRREVPNSGRDELAEEDGVVSHVTGEDSRQSFSLQSNATEEETTSQVEEQEVPPPSSASSSLSSSSSSSSAVLSEDSASAVDRSSDLDDPQPEAEEAFLCALPMDVTETRPPRVPPGELSAEERERRKRENLERKADNRPDSTLFSPLTSYVTAETELRELIGELEDAVVVGLHTCGDLASSTLRMFTAKQELLSVCSVGCCYHLLTEQHDPCRQECLSGVCGFPMSQYLQDQALFCGRNARMSACLALERVSVGQGIQMESLFYRAVLHVILRDHYSSHKSEKRVGNVYSKAKSFVDYVRRALHRLELDEAKLSDGVIQDYHDAYRPRMAEMRAFNMLKVTLAPCIEGLILLDRLCYLKEQEDVPFSALVQLFDPLLSPRCYAVVGVKTQEAADTAES